MNIDCRLHEQDIVLSDKDKLSPTFTDNNY